jgi:hypothetical protein
VFFDGLDGEGIVYSVLAPPLERGFQFLGAVGRAPPCSSKEPRQGGGVLSYSFIHTRVPTSGNIRMSEPNSNPQRRKRTARGVTEGLTR